MAWQRLLGSGALVLLAYLAVNILVIVTNPAKFVTQISDFVGEPIGDRSDEFRLYLNNLDDFQSNVTWELDSEACGFAWYWNTLGGVGGNRYDQHDNLCVHRSSVDYYAIEGVDTMSPAGMDSGCFETRDEGVFSSYRYCGESNITTHYFSFPNEDISELGLLEGASATDVELLFSTGSLAGVYELSEPFFVCEEPVGLSAQCTLTFQFFDERSPFSEVRNSTVEVRTSILGELVDLASREWLPNEVSKIGMEDGICEALASTEELLDCSIDCEPSYPYPSSSCVGTYEALLVKEIAHKLEIISVMTAVTVACWLSLSTLRLGMRTSSGRSRRGYLGAGGSSHHFFEEEGDRVSLANPIPPMQIARVSEQGTTIVSSPGSGFPICRQEGGEIIAGLGIVVCPGVKEIPREALSRTGTPVAVGDPLFTGSSLSRPGGCIRNSRTVPICFIVRENPDGSLKNLDVEEVHRLLDKSGGRALLDESFGGDHLAWARGFSVVDAFGCLLTLWTVHFVAANSGWGSFYWVAALVAYAKWLEETDVKNFVGLLLGGVHVTPKLRKWSAPPLPITLAVMEVLYDLSVPGVEVIGLIVTVIWTIIVVTLCGYFVFVLGYEPVYAGGGLYSTKVSLKMALAVGGALDCPFALAGDWVRGSRCGDIGGRLALSFCLATPETPHGTRVSHVNLRPELQSTLETGVLCGDGAGRPGCMLRGR